MSEEKFEKAEALEAWLKSRGVDEDDVAEAAKKLFEKGFNKPSRLLGITIQELKEYAGIEGPVARELSNRLEKKQRPNGKSRSCFCILVFVDCCFCILVFKCCFEYAILLYCCLHHISTRLTHFHFCSFLALSLILSDRTRPSSGATQVAEIPFKNRDVECEQLAVLLLNNRKCLRLLEDKASTEQSQERLTLATSSQMFGAGKSAFGKNFLSRLATQEKTLTNLRERFGDAVDWLLGLVPVVIDCQHLRGDSLLESLREEFLRSASKHVPEEKHELANNKLGKFTLSTVSCADLVKIFEECTGSSFFIHLDEMSSTPDFNGIEKEVTLLHQIWTEIKTARFQSQSEVFCSGRSAALFLMGKGNGYGGKRSPENADCVLLDPLDDQHVADIFADFQVTNEQPFIGRLHDFTSGVPRFVAHAVNFFTGRAEGPGEKSPDYRARRMAFMTDTEPFYRYVLLLAAHELMPLDTLPVEKRMLYVEMVRVAAYEIPQQLHKTINGHDWGLGQQVLTLEVCSSFPLYLKRCGVDHHLIVVPPIILKAVAKSNLHPRLPFWNSLNNLHAAQARAQNPGDLLENMSLQCLRLRVSEELDQSDNCLKEVLPFFAGSQIANDKLSLGEDYVLNFPKISSNSKRDLTAEQLKEWFEDPRAAGFSEVNPCHLRRIAPLLKQGHLYLPLPMSSSADLIFRTDKSACLVEMQFKNGKQEVTAKLVALELGKSFCSVCNPGVFVMLGLTVAEKDFSDGVDIPGKGSQVLGKLYVAGKNIQEFEIPRNWEVVVLFKAGMEGFLTKQNIELLHKDKLDLSDMKALVSPSKRRKTAY
jgi:hypothetical protein